MAYGASMTPVHLPASETGPGSWGRTSGLSIIDRVLHLLSFSRMEPRAGFEPAFPDYRSGASPPMLTGPKNLGPMERIERSSVAYGATALPLSYIGWRQSYAGIERHTCGNSGAGGDNRSLFSGLEAQGTPYIPRPLIQTFSLFAYSVVKDLS